MTLQWRNHVVLTFDLLKKLGSSKLGIKFSCPDDLVEGPNDRIPN